MTPDRTPDMHLLPRRRRSTGLIAASMATALVVASCGGDDGNGGTDNGAAENGEAVAGGGTISSYTCEPQNLQPGNNTENCGSRVLQQLFTGLTVVDHETNEAVPAVATDWETEDQVTWTFTLGEDWTFHNGDPVTAQTFVDSWNWVVDPDNAQAGANFHDKFLGYEEVMEGEAEEMEGVRAVDDHTLEIELTEPFGQLPLVLTYTSFYPMPEEAFEDMDAFQNAPVGNGRYEMDGEWVRDTEINMNRYEEWAGEEPGSPERIEWRIYSDVETAYMDVQAGELDILSEAPPNRIPQVEDDFGENYSQNESSRFVYIGLPMYQDEWDDVDLRHALSMAMDREEINDQIFDGAMTPAYSILPPTLPMARENACEYCEFDPEAAADLYEAAGGPSEFTMYTDTGQGHDEYVEAIANQWRANLPIDDISFQTMEFAQYLDLHDQDEITGPYRLGWLLAYPSPQYAMEPLYTTGAASNNAGYASEEFDEAIREANFAGEEESDELYQAAEDILLEDLPVLPLFFQDYFVVHTDRVDNVYSDLSSYVRVEDVVVLED
ncbi:peptide ABC transporter substrate-binding protein [Nesterenkonia muleiensis]|uniref:peptide ABC transporter substrate-binding protein n=1 Tax=Nesterenkonia muleiensis TaxID=2282648 RepID=UPI000E769561|nr:ABC transporter substrate-binding protein [Nesterenkonia muleiensis]